ncbi:MULTISPECIES: LysR family transcriptional regulator [unclassified Clostridium]|uniref:LysR family transcriptional regulator n=1 Tax=unclassified Clostridium TaxID=2614128 RepID=UPI0002983BD9|nr:MULTISPECIES: LysR family transcriptional regulator [unclassified Clostridium]EKQ56818.1 MAG: transcriptional regulator [Clostridium sp. Maddingley MBC34-26]
MISVDQMKYFIDIVEQGSLNKAAQHLFISQPALTKQLGILEKSMQSTLLTRTPNGIKLTPSGRYFYERSKVIISMINETINKIEGFNNENTIRIGALPNLITYFLPKYVDKFKNMNHEVSIEAMDTNSKLITGLDDNLFNIIFVSDAIEKTNYITIPLIVEPFFVVMSRGNNLDKIDEIDFFTIMKEKLILYKDPCPIRAKIREHCSLMNLMPNIILELEDTESVIKYVEKDLGITILPEMAVRSINNPLIVIREIKKFPIHRVISAIIKKEEGSFFYQCFYNNLDFLYLWLRTYLILISPFIAYMNIVLFSFNSIC